MRVRSVMAAMAVAAAMVPLVGGIPQAEAQLPPPGSAQTWFFAEGNTLPNWYEFITVINPDPNQDIVVTVEYQLEEPAGVPQGTRTRTLDVPAGQRRTLAVYDDLGRATGAGPGQPGVYTGVSARLTSTANFVAERPMYFINNFDVGEVNGAHDALGVNAASRTWYFAEGSTLQSPAPDQTGVTPGAAGQLRGFIPYWTMQNVSGANATVTITYRTNNPDQVVEKTITVPNNSRITTDIANAFNNPAYPGSLGPGFEGFGTSIASDQPIIVERPFYINREFPGIGFVNAATDERGALTANTTTRLFAEGTVLDGFFEFITVFNPNITDTVISLDYQVEGQTTAVTKSLAVPALSRRTVQVYNEASEGGLGRTLPNSSAPGSAGVSVAMTSDNGVGFVAERPMYFIRDFGNGPINGAHDVLGAGVADTSWFFAEGTLRNGFFEFITIQNPNAEPTTARLDYFINDRALQTNFRDLPANSRVTVVAFDGNSQGSLAQVLGSPVPADIDFGLRVTSVSDDTGAARPDNAKPIVVERPMYVNAVIAGQPPAINGGHNTLGFQFPAGEVPPLPGQVPETPGPEADLSISKAANNTTVAGGTRVTYTLTVRNSGPDRATGVVITDTLPAGMTYLDGESSANCSPGATSGTVICQPSASPDMNVAEQQLLTIVVRADCLTDQTESRINRAQIGAGSPTDPDPADNVSEAPVTVTCPPPPPPLAIGKSASPGAVDVGELLTYTITATNNGNTNADGVRIADTLPPGATVIGTGTPAVTSTANGQTTVTYTVGTLGAGETVTRRITARFSEPGDTCARSNQARVTSSNATGATSAPVATTVGPCLTVDKTGPTSSTIGGLVSYAITVTNDAGVAATGTTITDSLEGPATLDSHSTSPGVTCTQGATTIVCSGVTIPVGEAITMTVVISPTAVGSITNTVIADPGNGAPASDQVLTTITGPPSPALSLTKTDSKDPVAVGEPVTYTITATNSSGAPLAGVVVTDTLPDGATVTARSANCGPQVGDTVTCTIGTIAANSLVTATITVTFDRPGTKDNQADARSSNNDTASATQQTNVTQPLTLVKTDAPDPVSVGAELTYTLTATNTSFVTLTGITLTDVLPSATGVVRTSATPGATCGQSGGTITCTLAALAPGRSLTEVIVVTSTITGTITNTAEVTSSNGGFAQAGTTTEVTTLFVTKTDSKDPVMVGEAVTYTITATNTSDLAATGVILTDTLPGGATVVAKSANCGPQVGSVVTCTIGTIAANSSTTATITVTFDSPGAKTNEVVARSSNGLTAEASETTTVSQPLALTKTDGPDPVRPGFELTYTVTATNNALITVTGLTLTDLVPAGTGVVRVSASAGAACAASGTTVTCTLSSLPAGDDLTAVIVVTSTVTGTITNNVEVTSSNGGFAQASATTLVAEADLVASVELLSVSATEFYITTTVTNVGPSSVANTDVTFTITQDQGVVGMDPLVPSGTATGACGGLVGNPFTPGTWGGSCTDVVMAPGQFIRTVFHVFYATPPTLTARSEGFDRVVADPDTSNNIDTESTGP